MKLFHTMNQFFIINLWRILRYNYQTYHENHLNVSLVNENIKAFTVVHLFSFEFSPIVIQSFKVYIS